MSKEENPNRNKNEITSPSSIEQPFISKGGQELNPINEAEQVLNSLGEMSRQITGTALETAEIIENSELSKIEKDKFRAKLKIRIKKIIRIFSFATLFTGVASIADYKLTRYSVKSEIGENGNIIYTHED